MSTMVKQRADVTCQDAMAEMTDEELEQSIRYYEQRYGMTSEEFLRGLQDGTTLDLPHAVSWMILLRAR